MPIHRIRSTSFPSSAPDLVSAGTKARAIAHRYERRGSLVSRLTSWVQLVETCERELAGLGTDQCLVVDPDSRLTQLGLLPLVDAAVPSALFESRSYRASGVDTVSELTAHWLNATLGSVAFIVVGSDSICSAGWTTSTDPMPVRKPVAVADNEAVPTETP